ncbi:hypothetical protein M8J76_010037 [Diaphorina citri]|nr:hypothetical protein M8J75_005389 [Diaphorina citri]KAI5745316.1 hypothetical protein M8J76_010037 [Diaphorina citri]KAI5752706.1 hypothetical protein M8J77_019638 [Diaphorina citri]
MSFHRFQLEEHCIPILSITTDSLPSVEQVYKVCSGLMTSSIKNSPPLRTKLSHQFPNVNHQTKKFTVGKYDFITNDHHLGKQLLALAETFKKSEEEKTSMIRQLKIQTERIVELENNNEQLKTEKNHLEMELEMKKSELKGIEELTTTNENLKTENDLLRNELKITKSERNSNTRSYETKMKEKNREIEKLKLNYKQLNEKYENFLKNSQM